MCWRNTKYWRMLKDLKSCFKTIYLLLQTQTCNLWTKLSPWTERARIAAINKLRSRHVDWIPIFQSYTDPHAVEWGFGMVESCEPPDLFFCISLLFRQLQKWKNICHTHTAELKAWSKFGPTLRFIQWETVNPKRNTILASPVYYTSFGDVLL